jgi:hypothetical protein
MKNIVYLICGLILLLSVSGYSDGGEWCSAGRVNANIYTQPVNLYPVPAPPVTYIYVPLFVPVVYVPYQQPTVQTVLVPSIQYITVPQVVYQKHQIYRY